jgi:hypothetical protein
MRLEFLKGPIVMGQAFLCALVFELLCPMCSPVYASTISTYNLDLNSIGSLIESVGTVSIISNTKRDTLTYKFNLTNGAKLTEVFLDAGSGGTARHDLGSITNSLGTFTDSFAARGKHFSITFRGTDIANFTRGLDDFMYAAVFTTAGLFGDGTPISPPGGGPLTATPIPAALPLIATGLGGLGLLGWRRKRKAQWLSEAEAKSFDGSRSR